MFEAGEDALSQPGDEAQHLAIVLGLWHTSGGAAREQVWPSAALSLTLTLL